MKFEIIGSDGTAATVSWAPSGIAVSGPKALVDLIHSFIQPGTAGEYDASQGGAFMGYDPSNPRQVRLGLDRMARRRMIRSVNGPSGLVESDMVGYIGGLDSRDENVRNSVNDPAANRAVRG